MQKLNSAHRTTKNQVDEAIDYVPSTVVDAYMKILNQSPDQANAEQLLRTVLATFEPLSGDQCCAQHDRTLLFLQGPRPQDKTLDLGTKLGSCAVC